MSIIDSTLPSFYRREQAMSVSLPVYSSGSTLSMITSGTFTLYDQSKTVLTTGAITIASGIATYTVPALPVTTSLTDMAQEEWSLVIGGVTEVFRRDAFICLRLLHPVVSEPMLKRLVADLDNLRPPTITSYQPYLDEAWGVINRVLLQSGKRPYLIMNEYALADWHKHLTLESIFMDFETYMGEGRYAKRAEDHRRQAQVAFDSLKFEYDLAEANQRTAASQLVGAKPVLFANAPAVQWFHRGPRARGLH